MFGQSIETDDGQKVVATAFMSHDALGRYLGV
jgi:hypothetical protein